MRLLLAASLILLQSQELPPAYPREGATKLLENDDVIVWDIVWLQQAYPFHRHRYDHVGVYYASGDRVIVSPEGERRPVSTEAWNISFQRRGVTHAEEGASADPLRAVFVQMKREPRPAAGRGAASPVPGDAAERLDNDRVTVWEHGRGPRAAAPHRHGRDAVVVAFRSGEPPRVTFVANGTVHDSDISADAERTFVFEIK